MFLPILNISAPLDSVPFKRPASNGKRRFNDSRYSQFKDDLGYIAIDTMGDTPPLKGAIKISINVYRNLNPISLKFGDADNHLKAICDALNGIAFEDDRQIVDASISLHKGSPHISITIGRFD